MDLTVIRSDQCGTDHGVGDVCAGLMPSISVASLAALPREP
jgi:hypothetical protein